MRGGGGGGGYWFPNYWVLTNQKAFPTRNSSQRNGLFFPSRADTQDILPDMRLSLEINLYG